MSFEICPFDQGSREWLELRRTLVTASDVPIILGVSPYKDPYLLLNEKLNNEGEVLCDFRKNLFAKGHRIENAIRNVFHEEHAFMPMVLISKKVIGLMASLDGINVSKGMILEVKYTGKKNYLKIISGDIPKHHMAQVQAQLLVSGLDVCKYVPCDEESYEEIHILADKDYQNKIQEYVEPFYKLLTNWSK